MSEETGIQKISEQAAAKATEAILSHTNVPAGFQKLTGIMVKAEIKRAITAATADLERQLEEAQSQREKTLRIGLDNLSAMNRIEKERDQLRAANEAQAREVERLRGDRLDRYKPLCVYCCDGYKPQKFPTGWGHDDVPENGKYGSWPHGCKAGEALEHELALAKGGAAQPEPDPRDEQIQALRAALLRYGQHEGSCDVGMLDGDGNHCACTCGYEAALDGAKDPNWERLDWLEWFVQGDDGAKFYEEDGGVILIITKSGQSYSHLGGTLNEAIDEARRAHPRV